MSLTSRQIDKSETQKIDKNNNGTQNNRDGKGRKTKAKTITAAIDDKGNSRYEATLSNDELIRQPFVLNFVGI